MSKGREFHFAFGSCIAFFGWYLILAETLFDYAGKSNFAPNIVVFGLALFVVGIGLVKFGLRTTWVRALAGCITIFLGLTGVGLLLRAASTPNFDNRVYWLSWLAILLSAAILFIFWFLTRAESDDDQAT